MSQAAAVTVASQLARIRRRSNTEIEHEANRLLTSFVRKHGPLATPPIPVEDILEVYLRYTVDYDDLRIHLGTDAVLGALDATSRRVIIDQRLDPVDHPDQEGRCRFTFAHESGHAWLHVPLLASGNESVGLGQSEFVCWKRDTSDPLETEASVFASCLLMPRSMVCQAWTERLGNLRPLVFTESMVQPRKRGGWPVPIGDVLHGMMYPGTAWFRKVARIFAPVFHVSVQAMMIRLQTLGLLRYGCVTGLARLGL